MFKDFSDKDLLEIRNKCDELYYNSNEILLEDYEYDILIEELKKRNIYKLKIGHKLRDDDNIIDLPYYLGSLNKIKPDEENKLNRWLDKNNNNKDYLLEAKLDGVSCLYNTSLKKLYTRGDGNKGSNISYLVNNINNIPKIFDDINYYIRGELIINRDIFENKYISIAKNPRNLVSGLVNSKHLKEGINDVEFIAYEILNPKNLTPIEQLNKLKTLGFKTTPFYIENNITINKLDIIYNKIIKENNYDIDGIVIYNNSKYIICQKDNPKYALAYKPKSQEYLCKIKNIEWNISRYGILKPRIEIEPIKLKDITIKYITGHNAKFIQNNKIGKGSLINIIRSGDVIPKVVKVISPLILNNIDLYLPTNIKWKWDDNKVNIITEEDNEESIDIQNIKSITSFFEKINAKHISEKTIEKLYNYGAINIIDIIKLKKEQLTQIEGIKDKSAERIIQSIKIALNNSSITKIIGASNIFGYGIGLKKTELLFEKFPNILDNKISKDELLSKLNSIEGFSDISSQKIIYNLDNAINFINSLKSVYTIDNTTNNTTISNKLNNQIFLFSGFRDKNLEKEITDNGGIITNSITKKVNYLIVNDKSIISTKINKAKEYNIKIINIQDFKLILKQ